MNESAIIESLRSLHDLSKAINSSLRLDQVMAMVCEKTAHLMKAGRVLILLLDKERNTLNLHDSIGFRPEELVERQFRNIRPFDHCIVHKGTVITMDEVLSDQDRRAFRRTMPFLFSMFFAPPRDPGRAVRPARGLRRGP